jgi:signal transduction histidine kinase
VLEGGQVRGAVVTFVDISKRKHAEELLKKSRDELELRVAERTAQLRELANHLEAMRETERKRIAREIHDELGQSLTGLKMDLTWVANRLPGDQRVLAEKTKSMSALIDDTIQSVRKIASRLRPEVLDQLGLTAAIGWHAGDFRKRTGIRCKLSLPSDTLMLDRERSTAAFRIFQELLTNVARHANATRIDVAMQVESGALVLTVKDNGNGIAESAIHDPKSLGLLGMRERVLPFGGSIEIAGVRDKGTKARVSIPLGLK